MSEWTPDTYQGPSLRESAIKRLRREKADLIAERDAAVARAEAAEQAVARVRELHQPKRDHPLSLVQYEHCSCGAMEKVTAPDGYPALGPATYPCATIRALDDTP